MFEYVKSDLQRKRGNYVRVDTFVNRYLKITFQLGTLAAFAYRLAAWSGRRQMPMLRWGALAVSGLIEGISATLTGVRIDRRVDIGKGFVIHNFSCIVVDAEKIGENFTINQGVSVGPDWRNNGRPVIGNNVFVGAGAKVLGAVTVGDNVVIAANALVSASVPDNCTVAGVPARVVARQSNSSYLRFSEASM